MSLLVMAGGPMSVGSVTVRRSGTCRFVPVGSHVGNGGDCPACSALLVEAEDLELDGEVVQENGEWKF